MSHSNNINNFTIWVALDDLGEKEIHDINLKQYCDNVGISCVDSELVYKVSVEIKNSVNLSDLSFYFDDYLVLYGTTGRIIAPMRTLDILGLV